MKCNPLACNNRLIEPSKLINKGTLNLPASFVIQKWKGCIYTFGMNQVSIHQLMDLGWVNPGYNPGSHSSWVRAEIQVGTLV